MTPRDCVGWCASWAEGIAAQRAREAWAAQAATFSEAPAAQSAAAVQEEYLLAAYIHLDDEKKCAVCMRDVVDYGSYPCGCNDICYTCFSEQGEGAARCPTCMKEVSAGTRHGDGAALLLTLTAAVTSWSSAGCMCVPLLTCHNPSHQCQCCLSMLVVGRECCDAITGQWADAGTVVSNRC